MSAWVNVKEAAALAGVSARVFREEWVPEIRRQIATHKRFKRMVDLWIDLSIEHSQLTMRIEESGAT